MRRITIAIAAATALSVAMSAQQPPSAAAPLLSPGAAAARFPRNLEEFDQMFNQVKNWGRWGKDDQLGAANLITEARRKQALQARQDRVDGFDGPRAADGSRA